jgi:hypothetical protein
MAVTLGSTGITFPDATTQTTAATGGGAIQATFTAAAAITAGQTVQFTTGTNVTPVTGVISTIGAGSTNVVLSTGNAPTGNSGWQVVSTAYDPNTTGSFVSVSTNSSNNALTLVAGTTSSNTTTVGSVVTSSLLGSTLGISTLKVMFDPVTAGKGMVVFIDYGNGTTKYVRAIIFTVSGTTVTVQSATTLLTVSGGSRCAFSYYGQDTFVYAYGDGTSGITAYACSISTYTITQGTGTTLTATSPRIDARQQTIDMDYSKATSNLLGLSFINASNSRPNAVLFTVVPATKVITAGSSFSIVVMSGYYNSISFDPLVSTRFAVGCSTNTNAANYIYVMSFSGTTIGSAYLAQTIQDTTANALGLSVKYLNVGDGTSSNSVLTYTYTNSISNCCGTGYYGYYNSGIAAGTAYNSAYTWQTDSVFLNGPSNGITALSTTSIVSGQINKIALPYGLTTGTGYLRLGSVKITYTNLDSTKVIGIANASASSSASVVVNLWGGISTNQSGLTPNTTYYVDATGALTTSSTAPSLSMGKALTASTILLKTAP